MIAIDHEARADWPFLRDGAVTLFKRKPLFETAKTSLAQSAYRVLEIRCSTIAAFTDDLGAALRWQEQFGDAPWKGNLDALNDGLRGFAFQDSPNIALCFEDYHTIVAEEPKFAHAVLDVIERQSRNQLVIQRRLVALVQTDDGGYVANNLGAREAIWNNAEWLTANRR